MKGLMTHTETQIQKYEHAIEVLNSLPQERSPVPTSLELGIAELNRRLALMKSWMPGQIWQYGNNNVWVSFSSEPLWDWKNTDYRPAPMPEVPKEVWIKTHNHQTGVEYLPATVKPDCSDGWTCYVPKGGGQ